MEWGKAMFQLKRRLETMQGPQELSEEHIDDADTEIVGNARCDSKSEGGNRKLKAQFGRHHTHNEQLCVTSCGIILGRATFYGAEGLNGVWVCFVEVL